MEVAESVVSSIRTVRQFAQEEAVPCHCWWPATHAVCLHNPFTHQEKSRFAQRVETAYQMARQARALPSCNASFCCHYSRHARCLQVAVASSMFDGSIHLASNLCLVSVLGYGGSLVLEGSLTAGQLTSFLMYSVYAGINLASVCSVVPCPPCLLRTHVSPAMPASCLTISPSSCSPSVLAHGCFRLWTASPPSQCQVAGSCRSSQGLFPSKMSDSATHSALTKPSWKGFPWIYSLARLWPSWARAALERALWRHC